MISKWFLYSLLGLMPLVGFSRNNPASNAGQNATTPVKSYKTEASDCNAPTSSIDLDINNVRTRLLNGGDLWWDLDNARYEVPKSSGSTTPIHAIFAGSIWISGFDAGGNLKMAANTYRTNGFDFWAGPLDATGNVSAAVCEKWDNKGAGHFNVYSDEIKALQVEYKAAGGVPGVRIPSQLPASVLTDNIKNWPGKGNAILAAKGYNVNDNLAPFYDADGDGLYGPEWGDFPIIGKGTASTECAAYGDQMVFWVMNDKGNVHTGASGGQAMGVQVNALAFAFKTTDEINDMTFYRYTFINKSGVNYNNVYMSQFVDPDLGCSENDYLGCDTTRSMAFVYNGTGPDAGAACLSGSNGYGSELPMLGFDYFEGPTDVSGNQLGLSSFVYFNRAGNSCQLDPNTAQQYRNYQTGYWLCGRPITLGGTGYQPTGGTPINYVYPGNPSDATSWSECHPNPTGPANSAGDRRFLQTSGPFTLESNKPQNITLGVLFVKPKGGVGLCPDINVYLGKADDKAQALFDVDFCILKGPDAPTLSITELDQELILNILNLPGSNNEGEKFRAKDLITAAKPGFLSVASNKDSFYTFEGYRIYQLKDDKVSANDLTDATKAIEIVQMDVKNGVKRLINYERDATLGILLPKIQIEGLDNGISHSVRLKTDYFANGTVNGLINNKTYYYAAVAYASNVFMPFNMVTGEGQDQTYLNGSSVNRYSAIPHSLNGEEFTTNSVWGQGVVVKRVEGGANGANFIQINPDNYNKFNYPAVNVLDTIDYLPNGDPIGFKVVDPLKLKEAKFELKTFDTAVMVDGVLTPTAAWKLYDLTNNRVINGERTLDRPFEQIITYKDASTSLIEYGFSLTLGRPAKVYTNRLTNKDVFAPIGSKITYSDEKNKWLSFVKDNDDEAAANWIRSGDNLGLSYEGAFGSNFYTVSGTDSFPTDPQKLFTNFLEGTWAPYCLTSNYNFPGSRTSTQVKSVFGPGFKWKNYNTNGKREAPKNNLEKLVSVDIIFTNDKSKWTKCVVFEAGEDQNTNQGAIAPATGTASPRGARKGMLRHAESKDMNGNIIPGDTGRSYFPGYAVNVETGERLNMAFAEASDLIAYNGADMLWNPTSDLYSKVNNGSPIPFTPIWGGRHFVYVMATKYDEGLAMRDLLLSNASAMAFTNPTTIPYSAIIQNAYNDIIWATIPYVNPASKLNSISNGTVPNEVKVSLRTGKPYQKFETATTTSLAGDSMPRYIFSTEGLGKKDYTKEESKSALDDIRIVPNPYLAYSYYEKGASDFRVKITNLPRNCSINIYTLDGQLVKRLTRNIGANVAIESGRDLDNKKVTTNLDDATEWDLKNDKGIPIASGIYLFEVNVPGVGTKILRWFGAMRATDVSNF